MSAEEDEQDLDHRGVGYPGIRAWGLWGLAIGETLAAIALGLGALKRFWRARE